MTPAQAAQQDNRNPAGRYAEGHHGDPGYVLGTLQTLTGRHPDLALWEGVPIQDAAPGQTYRDGTEVGHGDFNAIYGDFMCPLDDWEDVHGNYTKQVTHEYLTSMVGGPLPDGSWVEATQEGALLHVPWQDEPVGYPAKDVRQHTGLMKLDELVQLRDGIRDGKLAPWAILSTNPAFEDSNEDEVDRLADLMRQHSNVDQAWGGPVLLAQQFLADKGARPKLRGSRAPWVGTPATLTAGIEHYERDADQATQGAAEAVKHGANEADLRRVLDEQPDLPAAAKSALRIAESTAAGHREYHETLARNGRRGMKEDLYYLHGHLADGIEAQQRARHAANQAQNEIHRLEQLSTWERSWPGQPGTCPEML